MSKELINLSNLQRFLSKLSEKFALKKAMKGISEDAEGNIIIGEEGLVPTPDENSKGKFLRSDGEWALPSVYDSMTLEEGVAGVSKVDRVLNAKNLKQIVNSDGFLTSLDSSKLTGVINIENLPQGALERILIVSSKEERLTLLDTEVQLGDVVKESDTGLMYYVINTEKLNSEEGYTQFTAGQASSVPWSGVTDKPTIPTKTSDLTNDSDFAIDSGVVHKTGDENISGTKMFSNTISRHSDLTTSGGEQVYNFYDNNTNSCGLIYNSVHWHDNAVFNRHGAYNAKSGKTMDIDITSNDAGDGMILVEGTARKGNLETVTSATDYTAIATMGWVNNPATSTNVVHRSGDETIAGNKTFSNQISFPSEYFITTDTNDNSLRIVRHGTGHGNNYKVIIQGDTGKFFAPNGFIGNLQGNADTATSANDPNAVHKTGDETIAGTKTFSNTIISNSVLCTNGNAFMAQNGGYTFLIRNDDTITYFLMSDKDGTPGTWSTARPLTINNATGVCSINGNANTATYATKATQDSAGQQINKTYIKELSVSGRTITYKRGDNTTGTITTQDTNTTYSKLSQFTNDTGFITSSGSCNYSNSAGNGIDSSGANYVKFKDGIQICFGANKGGDIVTFANAFIYAPFIAFGYNISTDVDRVIHGQAKYSSSTSFTMQVWDFKSNTWTNDRTTEWIAIGRWK